jgi:uncharacterized membrane protein YiaA
MRVSRTFVVASSVVVIVGVVSYALYRSETPLPEPAAIVLLVVGLFACAQARRHLLKKV